MLNLLLSKDLTLDQFFIEFSELRNSNLDSRKSKRHARYFGIYKEAKTPEEIAIESLLSKLDLIIWKNGTLNKQEYAINFGDPETLNIVSFENNTKYEKYSL